MIRHRHLLLFLGLFTPGAAAFVPATDPAGEPRRWHLLSPNPAVPASSIDRAAQAIRFYLPAETATPGREEEERNALRAALGQWAAVPGARIRFNEAGLFQGQPDINTDDGTNVVYWTTSSPLINGGLDSILNRVGLTYIRTLADEELAEADIVLNAVQYDWFTDFNATGTTNFFIESAVLHELGHFLGLEHSPAGGATMFVRAARGVTAQAGLSPDEMAAAVSLYPDPDIDSVMFTASGRVLLNNAGVLGAAVCLEDSLGNLVQATVTGADGRWRLEGWPGGDYQLRIAPLDPPSGESLRRMVTGGDIAPAYAAANTAFLPVPNRAVKLPLPVGTTLDIAVTAGPPAFRITRMVPPAADPSEFTAINAPVQLFPGTSPGFIGAASPSLPVSGAVLSVSGAGVTLGATRFLANAFGTVPAMNVIYASVQVAANAAPGLRTLRVTRGADSACANGFLEIAPAAPDHNFDGLDDRFQRAHFPVFTAPEAGPAADPDADGASNAGEFFAGTNPRSAASVIRLKQIEHTAAATRIRWQSVPGRRYQAFARDQLAGAAWQPLGSAARAVGAVTEATDAAPRRERYYRVEILPEP